MESDSVERRYSYQKDEFMEILHNEYTMARIQHISEDPEYEFLRTFHKANIKRFVKQKSNDDTKGAGLVLCPEKRSWNAGCHVENSPSQKSGPPTNTTGAFVRGGNHPSGGSSVGGGQNNQPQVRQNNRFVRGGEAQFNDQNKTRSIIGLNRGGAQAGAGGSEFRRNGNQGFNRARGGSNVGGLFTRNNYQPKGGHANDRYGESYLQDEEEPEWFSDGPTSFRDTIELGGLIDDDCEEQSSEKTNEKEEGFRFEKQDQGASRLLQLIAPKKSTPPAMEPQPFIEDRKQVENKLRSLLLRSDETATKNSKTKAVGALTLQELEASELGGDEEEECGEGKTPQDDVSPLKNFLNSISSQSAANKAARPQPTPGASRIFSMVTSVAQQNAAREHGVRSSSLDSDSSPPQHMMTPHDTPEDPFLDPAILNTPTNQKQSQHPKYEEMNSGTNIIESLFNSNSPFEKSSVFNKEECTSNLSSILARFGKQPPEKMHLQQQHPPPMQMSNVRVPPPGFNIPPEVAVKASPILSSLQQQHQHQQQQQQQHVAAPPGFGPRLPYGSDMPPTSFDGGIKPWESLKQWGIDLENQNTAEGKLLAAQIMQSMLDKRRAQEMVAAKKPGFNVSGGNVRAIVKQQRKPNADSSTSLRDQSYVANFGSTSYMQPGAPPPGFSVPQQPARRPISGQTPTTVRSFIPSQVQQQLAAKAMTNGELNSSIFQKMHLEQQKAAAVNVMKGAQMGRPIISDKTLPTGQNHL